MPRILKSFYLMGYFSIGTRRLIEVPRHLNIFRSCAPPVGWWCQGWVRGPCSHGQCHHWGNQHPSRQPLGPIGWPHQHLQFNWHGHCLQGDKGALTWDGKVDWDHLSWSLGDQLACLFFSIVLQQIVKRITEEVSALLINRWFLDDGNLAGRLADF